MGTIARPVLFAEHFGTAGYGAIAGAATLPIALMTALGPLGGAGLEQAAGYTSVMVAVAVLCVVAAVALTVHHRRVRSTPENPYVSRMTFPTLTEGAATGHRGRCPPPFRLLPS
nr:hypothetical protein GCM10020093_080160 [Planobispora longispora]